jgi:Uma2 family endonuclease
MATARAPRPATYADIEGLPEHQLGEIVAGEMHVSPRPGPRHAAATTRLAQLVGDPFDRRVGGPGGWWILFEPELHLGRDVVVPDLAGWRRERMPSLPESAWFEQVPDWVCEVVSPSTERLDRGHKLGVYAREGVAWVWLVNPLSRTLEVLRLEAGRYLILAVHEGDAEVAAPPFEAAPLALGSLWPEPGQGPKAG